MAIRFCGLILALCIATTFATYIRLPVELEDTPYKDILAQAACTAMNTYTGWTFAVRRPCTTGAILCRDICAAPSLAAQDSQVAKRKGVCINSLHVYDRDNLDPVYTKDTQKLGPKVYRYNSCTHANCGPNYCCCRFS